MALRIIPLEEVLNVAQVYLILLFCTYILSLNFFGARILAQIGS
jgi:hypothetical protein